MYLTIQLGFACTNQKNVTMDIHFTPAQGGGAVIIDMHGNEFRRFENITGFPLKMLPNGHIMGSSAEIPNHLQDMADLIEIDWDGNIVWKYDAFTTWTANGQKPVPALRQHHDFQREGTPNDYCPLKDGEVFEKRGKTLILCHENVENPKISDKMLLDDTIIEVDEDGHILWRWSASEHIDEFGFSPVQRETIRKWPNYEPRSGCGDWLHINCVSWLGENPWYDQGDERFRPENILFGSREGCVMCIISHETGRVVWRLGPDFSENETLKAIEWIIGQHHVHMIPKGFPAQAGYFGPLEGFRFYSKLVSSAQRLPNGNTLITEGVDGRIFEVTRDFELVWEFTNPVFNGKGNGSAFQPPYMNMLYRSYRIPYPWIPQLEPPKDLPPITPLANSNFRVPGSPALSRTKPVKIS